jgi:phosphate starvation-inducible protein PhoH
MMIKGYDWNNNFLKYNQIVCDGFVDENKSLEVFDMEVEDNHNFIIACSTRGEHGNNSGMVVHNCQNITQKEIITIITRIGKFSKCILLADPEQSDLFNGKAGGFVKIRDAFNDEEAKKQGIYTFEFTADDIMRSELVKFIVKRLEQPKPS